MPMKHDIEMVEGASDDAITQWVYAYLEQALADTDGIVSITVAGGSTPFPILSALAKAPLEWSRIAIWPGDDRIVPEDHSASNVGKIRAVMEPVGAQIVALAKDAKPPHFTLTWLGMGEDGHIASLFPNTDPRVDAPQQVRQITPDPLPPEAPFNRLSLTIPALLNSDCVMFVIRGLAKRSLFEDAVKGANDLPVSRLLTAAHQRVVCFS